MKTVQPYEVFYVGWVTDPEFALGNHAHVNNQEIVIVTKGQYEIRITGQTIRAKAGDVVYYPQGEVHSETSRSNQLEVLGVGFGDRGVMPMILADRGMFHSMLQTFHGACDKPLLVHKRFPGKRPAPKRLDLPLVSRDNTGRIETLIRLMREIWIDQPKDAQNTINVLLRTVLDQCRKQQLAHEHPVVTTLKNYINDNLHERITLDDLVKKARMSKYHVAHVFKQATGHAPMEYIRVARVQQARRLLMQSDLPLKVIAEKVGISDEYLLCRHFRNIMGSTPGSLRLPGYKMHDSGFGKKKAQR